MQRTGEAEKRGAVAPQISAGSVGGVLSSLLSTAKLGAEMSLSEAAWRTTGSGVEVLSSSLLLRLDKVGSEITRGWHSCLSVVYCLQNRGWERGEGDMGY